MRPMSCPECRPNWKLRLLWLGVLMAVSIGLAFVGARSSRATSMATGTPKGTMALK